MSLARDSYISLWFLVVGIVFWGPYFGLSLPDLSAVYGLFLLVSLAALALRLMRGRASENGHG